MQKFKVSGQSAKRQVETNGRTDGRRRLHYLHAVGIVIITFISLPYASEMLSIRDGLVAVNEQDDATSELS